MQVGQARGAILLNWLEVLFTSMPPTGERYLTRGRAACAVYLCQGDDDKLMRLYRTVLTGLVEIGGYGIAVDSFGDILHWVNHFRKLDLSELKDKNLSCWCNLQRPCHVDILLELAGNL